LLVFALSQAANIPLAAALADRLQHSTWVALVNDPASGKCYAGALKREEHPMNLHYRQIGGSRLLALTLLMLCALPGIAKPREGQLVVPENAYGNGSAYGKGWECSFGYKEKDDLCVAVEVPANGFISARGTDWSCSRGFREDSGECIEIIVPAGGYLTGSTAKTGWACERGYKETRETCEPIQLPPNAFLTNSAFGSGWECERGYREYNDACRKIAVPVNGYLVELTYGLGWQCGRGYSTLDDKTCTELVVPANAHLDRSGNAWECNRPYLKRGNACVPG
jgi:hypothetical protein